MSKIKKIRLGSIIAAIMVAIIGIVFLIGRSNKHPLKDSLGKHPGKSSSPRKIPESADLTAFTLDGQEGVLGIRKPWSKDENVVLVSVASRQVCFGTTGTAAEYDFAGASGPDFYTPIKADEQCPADFTPELAIRQVKPAEIHFMEQEKSGNDDSQKDMGDFQSAFEIAERTSFTDHCSEPYADILQRLRIAFQSATTKEQKFRGGTLSLVLFTQSASLDETLTNRIYAQVSGDKRILSLNRGVDADLRGVFIMKEKIYFVLREGWGLSCGAISDTLVHIDNGEIITDDIDRSYDN